MPVLSCLSIILVSSSSCLLLHQHPALGLHVIFACSLLLMWITLTNRKGVICDRFLLLLLRILRHRPRLVLLFLFYFTEKLLVLQLQNMGSNVDFMYQVWMHSMIVWCGKMFAKSSYSFCRIHKGNLENHRKPWSSWSIIFHRSHTNTPTQHGSQRYGLRSMYGLVLIV